MKLPFSVIPERGFDDFCEILHQLKAQERWVRLGGVIFVKMSEMYPYLIPINICVPLTFSHLACAKIKRSKFGKYEITKIKEIRKIP